VERLRQGLETKTAELRQLSNTRDLLDRDLSDLQREHAAKTDQMQGETANLRAQVQPNGFVYTPALGFY
jgi:hypothetical protein